MMMPDFSTKIDHHLDDVGLLDELEEVRHDDWVAMVDEHRRQYFWNHGSRHAPPVGGGSVFPCCYASVSSAMLCLTAPTCSFVSSRWLFGVPLALLCISAQCLLFSGYIIFVSLRRTLRHIPAQCWLTADSCSCASWTSFLRALVSAVIVLWGFLETTDASVFIATPGTLWIPSASVSDGFWKVFPTFSTRRWFSAAEADSVLLSRVREKCAQ